MALPRKLKNFNVFNDGTSYIGLVNEFTLPTLSRKMEDYRAAGMSGPVPIDFGQEAINVEWKCGGFMREVLAQYGVTTHNGVQLRFAGAYQADDTAEVDAVEIVIRGRHREISQGTAKVGDDTEFGVTTACSYYKLSVNGAVVHEFDFIAGTEFVGGGNLLSEINRAIGL